MDVILGAAGMLLIVLLVLVGIPKAFILRMKYVDDVASGKRQKLSLLPKKAPVH